MPATPERSPQESDRQEQNLRDVVKDLEKLDQEFNKGETAAYARLAQIRAQFDAAQAKLSPEDRESLQKQLQVIEELFKQLPAKDFNLSPESYNSSSEYRETTGGLATILKEPEFSEWHLQTGDVEPKSGGVTILGPDGSRWGFISVKDGGLGPDRTPEEIRAGLRVEIARYLRLHPEAQTAPLSTEKTGFETHKDAAVDALFKDIGISTDGKIIRPPSGFNFQDKEGPFTLIQAGESTTSFDIKVLDASKNSWQVDYHHLDGSVSTEVYSGLLRVDNLPLSFEKNAAVDKLFGTLGITVTAKGVFAPKNIPFQNKKTGETYPGITYEPGDKVKIEVLDSSKARWMITDVGPGGTATEVYDGLTLNTDMLSNPI